MDNTKDTKIISKVKEFIKLNHLLAPTDKIVIGVSGGSDSMALLDILYKLGYDCIIAHCNFHLRENESNRDELFVETEAKKYKAEYECVSFDTLQYMQENSLSLEMAARELRYTWFEKIRVKHNAHYIAVAHHEDDSVETVIINIVRGTGLKGLTGIKVRNGYIIRPLLNLSKSEILNYLLDNNVPYIDDSTNFENIYTRNKIRLNLIPQLETINPSIKQSIARMTEYLSQVELIYKDYIRKSINSVFINDTIDIQLLQNLVEPKSVLFEILQNYGFNSHAIQDIYRSLDTISGKVFLSDKVQIIKDRNKLLIEPLSLPHNNSIYTIRDNDTQIEEPINLFIENIKHNENFKLIKSKQILYLDKNKIKFPLHIRKWKQGDKFTPFGMKGSKKLSDYFTDNKFSLIDKSNIWLLTDEKEIIWIIGERPDNRFRIDKNTSDIIKISLIETK